MEAKPIDSPDLEIFTPKSDDFKYICSLSTILVATIQEVKDRVTQIELIFCSQLFPKFQSNSKSFQIRQEEWKARETNLSSQIEELKLSLLKEREEREAKLSSEIEELKLSLLKEREEREANLSSQIEELKLGFLKERDEKMKLMKEIECKDQILEVEQSKRTDMIQDFVTLKERYNSLKSQYTYLIGKLESKHGNLKLSGGVEEKKVKSHSSKRSHEDFDEIDTKEISPCTERKSKPSLNLMSASTRSPQNCTSDNDGKLSWRQTNKVSTSPKVYPKSTSVKPTVSLSGQKRSTTWRDTRTLQKPSGANTDLHDDFLNTPIEMAKTSKSDKSSTATARGTPVPQEPCRDKFPLDEAIVPPPHVMDLKNSDEETQDLTTNKISIQPKEKSFKYIEPVRKKADRENLKGIECKQCKKFYDAVLPENGQGREQGAEGIGNSLRCEHHEGVSRHRYKYAPPLTPEGFWNIGFESEM